MPDRHPLFELTRDGRLLFATRILRLFAYGFLSVMLVLYLEEVGLSNTQIGALLTLTLVGDTLISLWLTTSADRIGRRRTLIAGATLMVGAGIVFALTQNFYLLLIAATIGIISPSGSEVGPFLSIEQAALSHTLTPETRTSVFAWYNLVGSFATAAGALACGFLSDALSERGFDAMLSNRFVLGIYALAGLLLALLFIGLTPAIEISGEAPKHPLGLSPQSRRTVFKLSALFGLDAFAGGLVLQSIVAAWFHHKFGVEGKVLGGIFFGANMLAGISALAAVFLAKRFGLVNTMVFTHVPSNLLLMLVPLMPTLPLAIGVLLVRYSISQMDVPTRQSYVMSVVDPAERSAAAGITGIARTTGSALSPLLAESLMSQAALASIPFYLAGALKLVYDGLLYRSFSHRDDSKQSQL